MPQITEQLYRIMNPSYDVHTLMVTIDHVILYKPSNKHVINMFEEVSLKICGYQYNL